MLEEGTMDFYKTSDPALRMQWIQSICRYARSQGIPNKTLVRYRELILSARWGMHEEIMHEEIMLVEDLRFLTYLDKALAETPLLRNRLLEDRGLRAHGGA